MPPGPAGSSSAAAPAGAHAPPSKLRTVPPGNLLPPGLFQLIQVKKEDQGNDYVCSACLPALLRHARDTVATDHCSSCLCPLLRTMLRIECLFPPLALYACAVLHWRCTHVLCCIKMKRMMCITDALHRAGQQAGAADRGVRAPQQHVPCELIQCERPHGQLCCFAAAFNPNGRPLWPQ